MSLLRFHMVLILTAILLAFGFTLWEINQYRVLGEAKQMVIALVSLGVGLLLSLYLGWFLKKLDKLKQG